MPPGRPPPAPPGRHRRPQQQDSQYDDASADTLWVGNLSSETVDSDLMSLFGEHGALDCTTMQAFKNTSMSRAHAFVYFRTLDEARAAKDALQGSRIHGSSVRIQFARPAKPFKNLWMGGISSSTTKEQLKDEFSKFGKIEECTFLRDRNSAIVAYCNIEDAVAAQKNMNGKCLAGEHIRVDFLRLQSSRRELPGHHDSRNGQLCRSAGPPELWMSGPKGHMPQGGRENGPPSNILWIGYPPTVRIDEQMLHNAMILFGEIERIKCFPERYYSLVEFRSIDEARRAKEGLQGRLFNDSRIQILFSRREHKDNSPPLLGLRGPRSEMVLNNAPRQAAVFFGSGCLMAPNSSSVFFSPPGPIGVMRPFAPRGVDPHYGYGGPEFHEFSGAIHNFPDGDPNYPIPPNWQQLSPVPETYRPTPGMQPPFRPKTAGWDRVNSREPKRSRIDGMHADDSMRIDGVHADDSMFHSRTVDGKGTEEPFGIPYSDRGALGPSQLNRLGRSYGCSPIDNDTGWRGIIAKGGNHVCFARCVPVGKGIGSPLPEKINCSAKTGLDMLTKHYAEANGFDVVFFIPGDEGDFDAYTDFLCYLKQKDRAGVAKLDDGTTLFLVPPSNFLSKVLNVSGPERLYGVVLKFPQQPISSVTQCPQLAIPPGPSHCMNQQQIHDLQIGYNFVSQNEDQTLNLGHGRTLPEGSMPRVRVDNQQLTHSVQPYPNQSTTQDYISKPAATSQVEVSLTPELLATFASVLPNNTQTSFTGTIQTPSGTSMRPASSTSVVHDGSMSVQGWRPDHQVTVPSVSVDQPSYPSQHLVYQHNNQLPLMSLIPQFQAYPNIPSGSHDSALSALGSTITPDPSMNLQQAVAVTSKPLNSHLIPSLGSEQVPAFQGSQQYQFDSSFASHNSYNMLQEADPAGVYNPLVQQLRPDTSPAHVQSESLSQPPQIVVPLSADQVNMGCSAQGQQLQAVLSSLSQGTSESDADKNQRYQSTLQFAASLLLQLQQQQQVGSQAVESSKNP